MGLTHSPKIVTDGLVLCLDAANPKSYPGSGTTWFDLSGNGNNGTLVNGVGFNSDNSMIFDGVDDRATTTSNIAFGTNPFSIGIWFKPNGSQPPNASLACIAQSIDFTNWQISFTSNILRFFAGSGQEIISTYTTGSFWTNVYFVRESISTNGFKIYINGSLDVTGTVTNNFTDTPGYRIGVNRGNTAHFKGDISNINVYTKAFSAQEIQQNFNALRGRYGL
jgi:hypothetical protein